MKLTHADRQALVAGDQATWKQFIAFSQPFISAAIGKRNVTKSLSGIDADDLVQDVYARLLADDGALLEKFDETRGSLPAFLTLVAGSTALNAVRAKARQQTSDLEDIPEPQAPEMGDTSDLLPSDLLTPRETLIVRCKYDRDLDAPDIAKLLGIGASTVRVTLKSALDKLRANKAQILGEVS